MKERSSIILLVLIFLFFGILTPYLVLFYSGFNFSDSEIIINNNIVTEKLTYHTDKDYHTLYRNFETPISSYNLNSDYISISEVNCSSGSAYSRSHDSSMQFLQNDISTKFTENNEYGCTFGDSYGFKKGNDYWISSTYELHPTTLLEIKGKTYINFIAYSKNNHKTLIKNKNFHISGDAVTQDIVFSNQPFIVYIPYAAQGNENIIKLNDFKFPSIYGYLSLLIFLSLLPAILVFVIWYFLGRENFQEDMPELMSYYPKDRKPWEVTTFFIPPFGRINQHFVPAMLMDFYNRKIIDIKTENKEAYVKILKIPNNLDAIETKFMDFLNTLKLSSKGNKEYFSLKMKYGLKENIIDNMAKGIVISKIFTDIQKEIQKISKKYFDLNGMYLVIPLLMLLGWISLVFYPNIIFFYALCILIVGAFSKATLFMRYKKEYYKEYQHWQAFKKYISSLDFVKVMPPEGVVIWEKYLVYATALGVEKKILKILKDKNLINQNQYNNYSAIYITSNYYSSYTGSTSGGGFGGAGGGGGMGGGGGGGR
jgi:uncharacterized membrane protein